MYTFDPVVETDHMTVWVYSLSSSIGLYLPFCLSLYHAVIIATTLYYNWKLLTMIYPALLFLLRISLAFVNLFPLNFRPVFSGYVKNVIVILVEIVLSLKAFLVMEPF